MSYFHASNSPIVIDMGSGYTKIGFASNSAPSYVFPTVVGYPPGGRSIEGYPSCEDLDFAVGEKALGNAQYIPQFPVNHGIVTNWDDAERILNNSIYQKLRCNPEDHFVLFSEPINNVPENREYTAEVLFESLSVPGINICPQAVLALFADYLSDKKADVSLAVNGVVVDSGDDGTTIVPVAEGFVLSTAVKTLPIGGRDVTDFIVKCLRDRNEPVPPEDIVEAARFIKENMCECVSNIMKEFGRYDDNRSLFKQHRGISSRNNQPWTIDVGYEMFIGPELYFNPEILNPEYTRPLADLVDEVIMKCPIDVRRPLYSNIVLAGGSTKFEGFKNRLRRDLNRIVERRYEDNRKQVESLASRKPTHSSLHRAPVPPPLPPSSVPSAMKKPVISENVRRDGVSESGMMDVKVVKAKHAEIATWLGGSYLAAQEGFVGACVTKAQYEEQGARVVRRSLLTRLD